MNMNRKRAVGLTVMVLSLLVFIFACLAGVLSFGKWIVSTLGIIVYPFSLIFAFIGLANFLGFSYRKNVKGTTYFLVALFSLLFVIHSIATYKVLNAAATWETMKAYLDSCYVSSTLLGSFGSIFTGLISMLLGGMGTIVVFVILTTIFVGLFVDYELYGKFEEPRVKKLKSRKLREQVQSSDSNLSENGTPNYSFNDEVVDEVTVDAEQFEQNQTAQSNNYFDDNEVVATISDNGSQNYFGDYEYNSQTQTVNHFSDDNVVEREFYPDVYSSSEQEKRDFIGATFGGMQPEPAVEDENENDYYDTHNTSNYGDLNENDDAAEEDNFDNNFSYETNLNNFEDSSKISDILSSSEDDEDEFEETSNKLEDGDDEPDEEDTRNTGFAEGGFMSRFNEQNAASSEPTYVQPVQPTYVQPEPTFVKPKPIINTPAQNSGFGTSGKIVVPSANPSKSEGNIGMRGIRYNPPPLSLLRPPKQDTGDYTEEQQRKSKQLEQVLEAFNVPAKVENIVRGPKITRYELSVPLGVSVKKIPGYEDDIAAALSAKTITIRAPIPGSPYVGIELENDTFTNVYERELLESDAFQNAKDPLPVAIGKDISGEIVVKSLAKMVHLLIAGSTGSGKSVFIHNIVLSLIYKNSPDDLRLIMIDPKRVEFNRYNGLPHLLTPEVVMGSEKAINSLKWAVKEMQRRYDLMSKAGYNNIEPYNKSELVKAGQFEKFPYIVIIVDELAEIMMYNKKDAESCIQSLTQLARACGMHLILATQRPSVDIISGVIKNNVPSRIAFSLQSGIDSKTILTTTGAEKLLGQGDMIFAPTGTAVWPRLQAAYATDEEIKAVIDYDIANNQANFDDEVDSAMENMAETSTEQSQGGGDVPAPKDTVDGYFKAAVKIVMQNGGASVSYLQRRLSIGYSRAARIVDQMEERGYIAHANGSKTRQILITPEQFEADFGEPFNDINF